MRKQRGLRLFSFLSALVLIVGLVVGSAGQSERIYDKKSDPEANRRDGLNMLKQINRIVERYYYDPSYRGMNIKERFKAAEEQIKTQDLRWQIHRTIAQVLLDFNDSHTSFIPPDRLYRVEYGFSVMMIANSCFVTDVKRGSDAEKQGLKAGDQIVDFNGIVPSRDNLWAINYLIYTLDPQETIKLKLRKADSNPAEITVTSRFMSPAERKEERRKRKNDEQSTPYKCQEISPQTIACKLRTFIVDKNVVDKMMKTILGYQNFIFDLRGNSGGYVETEIHLTGYFFEHQVKIGTEVLRNKQKDRFTKVRKDPYAGELFVLIDSQSASASEVFARTIQLEKRGKVIGDTSMGAVMSSYGLGVPIRARTATIDFAAYRVFGVNITIGDLIMSDGNRLEGVGVSPDYPVGPTTHALATRTDPVLAFAAELAGTPVTAEKAGEFFFISPKAEEENDKEAEDEEGN